MPRGRFDYVTPGSFFYGAGPALEPAIGTGVAAFVRGSLYATPIMLPPGWRRVITVRVRALSAPTGTYVLGLYRNTTSAGLAIPGALIDASTFTAQIGVLSLTTPYTPAYERELLWCVFVSCETTPLMDETLSHNRPNLLGYIGAGTVPSARDGNVGWRVPSWGFAAAPATFPVESLAALTSVPLASVMLGNSA